MLLITCFATKLPRDAHGVARTYTTCSFVSTCWSALVIALSIAMQFCEVMVAVSGRSMTFRRRFRNVEIKPEVYCDRRGRRLCRRCATQKWLGLCASTMPLCESPLCTLMPLCILLVAFCCHLSTLCGGFLGVLSYASRLFAAKKSLEYFFPVCWYRAPVGVPYFFEPQTLGPWTYTYVRFYLANICLLLLP